MISQVSRCRAASTAERSSSAAVSEKFPAATTPRLCVAGACVDLVEVVGGEPARADHDVRAVLERRHDVVLDGRGMREVDEDVGRRGRERLGDGRVVIAGSERETPPTSSRSSAASTRAAIALPGPAGDPGDADAKGHRTDLLASGHEQRPVIWKPRYATRRMRERAWAHADLRRERRRGVNRAGRSSRGSYAAPEVCGPLEAAHVMRKRRRPSRAQGALRPNDREHLVALSLHQRLGARFEVQAQERLRVRRAHVEVPVVGLDRQAVEMRDLALRAVALLELAQLRTGRPRPAC